MKSKYTLINFTGAVTGVNNALTVLTFRALRHGGRLSVTCFVICLLSARWITSCLAMTEMPMLSIGASAVVERYEAFRKYDFPLKLFAYYKRISTFAGVII
ncbi:MAG: hypothetical protein LBF85_02685 [Tannerella sp.]|nr:hypothetical protein [Tannerella sp.]